MVSSDTSTRRASYTGYMRGLRKLDVASSLMILADVAIETTTRELGERLFTYEVPPHLRDEVFIGSQVLVPFGHQELISGYVVALRDGSSAAGPNAPTFTIKKLVEVLESEPLFDSNYIGFLHWTADYYAASIGEVIGAAIPSDFGPKSKRVVRLVAESGHLPSLANECAESSKQLDLRTSDTQPFASSVKGAVPVREMHPFDRDESALLAALKASKSGGVAVRTLKQRCGLPQSKFYGALARLRQRCILAVEREQENGLAPKTVDTVILSTVEAQTKKQELIVSTLKRGGGQMPISELAEAASTTSATIRRMCTLDILRLVQDEVIRDPLHHLVGQSTLKNLPDLTPAQADVLKILQRELEIHIDQIAKGVTADSPTAAKPLLPWLLHGVTGSGKTEIYLRLIDQVLKSDGTALMLVPEISLTPQLSQRLVERFGNMVAVWHSGLTPGERYDTWRRMRAGQARVLLGARSAILANIPNLQLIILDEEHDSSYKQSSPSPRYNAKTLAMERSRREGAMVLFGSATPDVATYFECKASNRIVELPERVFRQALPESVLVDMRLEFANDNRSVFSQSLQRAIQLRLERNEQTILLINRRGYASHVLCRACGFVVKCRNCSVSLTFHQTSANGTDGYLICHHCAFKSESWQICPACQSPFIKQFGLGTQRVEQEAQELFPTARLLRLDSDVSSKRGATEEIFGKFAAGEADILIGTQIVAKGLDIANVTLVGVLAADSAFNLPDYRSVERGFQLLTQVSGRAGRGRNPGQVLLQTYNIDMPALTLARKQDYAKFVAGELESRKAFEYPPFSQLIRVVVAGEDNAQVEFACDQLAEELSHHLDDNYTEDEIKILGPAPCLIERLRGKFRHHLIIKNLAGEGGRRAVTSFLRTRRGQAGLQMATDIEALDLV